MKTKVFIVDDHPIIIEGLVFLIEQSGEFEVIGTAYCFDMAIAQMEIEVPELAIVDIGLPGKNGIDLVLELKCRFPQVKAIMFSMHDELTFAPKALRAGACGYVMKSESPIKLLLGMREVIRGKIFVNENVKDFIFNHFVGKNTEAMYANSQLTLQEENIFRLIGMGKSIAQIARTLSISPKTVQSHRDNIRHKFNITSSSELYRHAFLFIANDMNISRDTPPF